MRTKFRCKNRATTVHLLQCKTNLFIHLRFWGRNLLLIKEHLSWEASINIKKGFDSFTLVYTCLLSSSKSSTFVYTHLVTHLFSSTFVYTCLVTCLHLSNSSTLVYIHLHSSSDSSILIYIRLVTRLCF